MAHAKSPEIAKLFALAVDYKDKVPVWPYFSTPKLNGVRGLWIPGVGFMARSGMPWVDGVLPHLESALKDVKLWVDGELYCHGMSLQDINGIAGAARTTAHKDVEKIKFHALDSPNIAAGFEIRQSKLYDALSNVPHVELVPFKNANCCDYGNRHHETFVSMGYEGTVYKHPGSYLPGRTDMMIKRKAWQDDDFEVVRLIEGHGKYDGTLGAVLCKMPDGQTFEVGCFKFDDTARHQIWLGPKPKTAKVKYLGLTDRGVPYNTTILLLD